MNKKQSGVPEALSIRKNMIWNMVGSLTYYGCQWLMSVLVVRLSGGYEVAGTYSLVMSVWGIFSPLAEFAIGGVAITDAKGEHTKSEYLSFKILTTIIAAAICISYGFFTIPLSSMPALIFYVASYGMYTFKSIYQSFSTQSKRMDYGGKSNILLGIGNLTIFTVSMALTKSLEITFCAMAIFQILICLLYDKPHAELFGKIPVKFTFNSIRSLFISLIPLVIANFATSASPNLPRQMLFGIEGQASLGAYASIAAPTAIIQVGATYIFSPLLTYFADAIKDKNSHEFKKLFILVTLGVIAGGIVCTIGLALFAKPLLSLMYGQSIVEHLYLLYPIIAVSILLAYQAFLTNIMIATRTYNMQLVAAFAGLIIAAGSASPLINIFGGNGVSYAMIASCLVASSIMLFSIARTYKKIFR